MATFKLEEIKTREAARRLAAADTVAERLRAAAPHLRGRFFLVGSYPEGRMRFDSDLDVIVDVPPEFESQGWDILEDTCRENAPARGHPVACNDEHVIAGTHDGAAASGSLMSDARWLDVDDAVAAAVRHFARAVELNQAEGFEGDTLDAYRAKMALAAELGAAIADFRRQADPHNP